MDVQGADVARPYVLSAKAEYTNLVDSENVLADRLGLKIVPNIHLIDETGLFQGQAPDRAAVEEWLRTDVVTPPAADRASPQDADGRLQALERLVEWTPGASRLRLELADAYRAQGRARDAEDAYEAALHAEESPLAHFRLSSLLLEQGRRDAAIEHLRRAARLEPDNVVIRKQLWAVEAPDRFYSGSVDYGWQRQQMEREASEAR